MTGFGLARFENENLLIKAEIKSLNNKYTEVNIRLPRALQSKETAIRGLVSSMAERGSITASFAFVNKNATTGGGGLNTAVLKGYLTDLQKLAVELGLDASQILSNPASFPDAFLAPDTELSEQEWKHVLHTLNEAFEHFDAFRIEEGKSIATMVSACADRIAKLLTEVGELDGGRIDRIRERIKNNLDTLVSKDQSDPNRFEQELIFYLEKLDISEEKSRLAQHISYFADTMKQNATGKKLGFIAQEIGREVNTIGSKAADFGIQQLVVQMKDELEKIKEQVLNVV